MGLLSSFVLDLKSKQRPKAFRVLVDEESLASVNELRGKATNMMDSVSFLEEKNYSRMKQKDWEFNKKGNLMKKRFKITNGSSGKVELSVDRHLNILTVYGNLPHPTTAMKDNTDNTLIPGIISSLNCDNNKMYGYIKPRDPSDVKEVRFYFNTLKNITLQPITIGPESDIMYAVDKDDLQKVVLVEVSYQSRGEKTIFLDCGHVAKKKCHQRKRDLVCAKPCTTKMSCGLHKCPLKCGQKKPSSKHLADGKVGHDHSGTCGVLVSYTFPQCGHKFPKKKQCGKEIDEPCKVPITVNAPCGQMKIKPCYSVCQQHCNKVL